MIDLAFGEPFTLKKLEEQSVLIKSAGQEDINPGDYYLEDKDGKIFSLVEVAISDFYGDLQISESNDLKIVQGDEANEQQVFCRARTSRPDWPYHPWIGANLEELKGLPNTESTADKGIKQIYEALSRDDRFNGLPIEIIPLPISKDSIIYYIFLGTGDDATAIPIQISL